MKMKSVLRSNHDLKKNGYQILRKLHKMETRKGAKKAYATTINNAYFFVLSIRALAEIIEKEYPEESFFLERCNRFLSYLNEAAAKGQRLNSAILSSFLHSYTCFFNYIISINHAFLFNNEIIELWNTKCLMAYLAAWS